MQFFLISVNLFLNYLFAKQSKDVFYFKIIFENYLQKNNEPRLFRLVS